MTTTPEPGATPTPPAPPATAMAPPAAPAPDSGGGGGGGGSSLNPVVVTVCVLGAVLVLVSIFLNWLDLSVGRLTFSFNGREVPLDFLWDKNSNSEDPSLIVALIPVAILIGVGAMKKLRWLALAGGILAIVIAVLFGYQADRLLDDAPPQVAGVGFFDFIGIAPWFVLVGGILGVVGAIVPRRTPSV